MNQTRKLGWLLCLWLAPLALAAQDGCTDSAACNYDAAATVDDGSCVYDTNACGDCTTPDAVCIGGCTDPTEANFSSLADYDDGSCGPLGIVEDVLLFRPTTIDSVSTATIHLVNGLGVAQSANFLGLSTPISISPENVEVPADDTLEVTLQFSPGSVAEWSQTLTATGSAFGSDALAISAEGTLPQGDALIDSLDFGSVSVNSIATRYIPLASFGLGTLHIDSISTDSPELYGFGNINVTSGDTAQVPIYFFTELSGIYTISATLHTTDPFNTTHTVTCSISAISEVGGEVCGTWSLINSPYQLIDNVVVPNGCTLTIEPGVIVLGDSLDIEVFGALYANGTAAEPIEIYVGELLSHTSAENMVLTSTTVVENNEFVFPDFDYRNIRDANIISADFLPYFFDFISSDNNYLYQNENADSHFGKYVENFSDNNGQGWSRGWSTYTGGADNSVSFQTDGNGYYSGYDYADFNGEIDVRRDCCYSSNWFEMEMTSPEFDVSNQPYADISFRSRAEWWSDTRYLRSYVRFDGGDWELIDEYTNLSSTWTNFNFEFDIPEGTQTLEFRYAYRLRYYGRYWLDDFILTTSFYPGLDVPMTAAAAAAASMSTGGLQLAESTYNGDFHSISDSIAVYLDRSNILGNPSRDKDSHGIALYADHVSLNTHQSAIGGHAMDGVHVESQSITWASDSSRFEENGTQGLELNGDVTWTSSADTIASNGTEGVRVTGNLDWSSFTSSVEDNGQGGVLAGENLIWNSQWDRIADNASNGVTAGGTVLAWWDSTQFAGNGGRSLEAFGDESEVTLYQTTMNGNGGGVHLHGSDGDLQADYSFITENGGHGVLMGYNSELRMDNSLVAYNSGNGIVTDGAVDLNYMNVLHNGGAGIHTNQFSTVNNSIVWFNGGVPQMSTSNTYASSYTNVQGINALLTSTEFAWGDGCIGTDPVLADSLGHLDPFSPCVDGGMPWEQDAHIPYGLGSSRADMGMYGGPANAYWGGQAPPDGAVVITDLFDIPQDQGGTLGLHFSASPFDFGGLGFNVTHYSIWRDLALGSDVPTIVGEGNWEQIGEVPAQGFSQYGYTASTLVDAVPGDSTCLSSFIVIAHTTDDNIYWVSEVVAACSYDNLAPVGPDLDGDVLMDDPENPVVVLSWPVPEEEDYAYTVIERAGGTSSNVVGDTLLLDADVVPGVSYDYFGYHLDLNGNASDTAYVTVMVDGGRDVIALAAGWNLISLDRTPDDAALEAVMGSLAANNLQYAIGFDQGVTLYDPTGLPFLNTLTSVQDGFGYWVKVTESDTLRVQGQSIEAGYLPALDAGWNLVAYTAENDASPGSYLADLLANDNLEYVTGFDGGVEVYDPNGLPFLNSLTALRNGFGYWVKTESGTAGLAEVESGGKSPAFDVVNGRSDLAAGTAIEVLSNGEACATIEVLPGGWLMTTALHGDDPATSALEGLTPGTELQFRHEGRLANESITWQGDMRLTKLDLHFGGLALALFPNPVTEGATVTLDLPQAGMLTLAVFGAQGQRIKEQVLGASKGVNTIAWSMGDLAPGVYQLQARMHGKTAGSIEFLVK